MKLSERKCGPFPADFFLGGVVQKCAPVTFARRGRNFSLMVVEDAPTPRWRETPTPLTCITNQQRSAAPSPLFPALKPRAGRFSRSQCDIRPSRTQTVNPAGVTRLHPKCGFYLRETLLSRGL